MKKREIATLVADGLYREALSLYAQLHSVSFRPNKFTFPSLLKACGNINAVSQGQMLHTHLIKTGFQFDTYTATSLMAMYMKLHFLDNARKVFDEMPELNIALLNVGISGLSRNGYYKEAFSVFRMAGSRSIRPDSVTTSSLLSACRNVKDGVQVHCCAVKMGVEADVFTATSLVTMYSNCGELVMTLSVFDQIQNKNAVCYNAIITALLHNGVPHAVLDVFNSLRRSLGEPPTSVALISVLSACAALKYSQFGKQVHGFIVKIEMDSDTVVGTALVDMYSKCGNCHCAYAVFKELNDRRNLITWNSMITGMMFSGQSENAVELFRQLEAEGLEPDSATWNAMISGFSHLGKEVEAFFFFRKMQSAGVIPSLKSVTSLLSACSAMSILRHGKEIHGHVVRTSISEDEFIATALIDMYMKCGHCSFARRVFDQFEIKHDDPAIWNAMISGYGRNGDNDDAFEIFDQMLEEQVQPNSATFSCILSVCSHTGLVDKGREVYRLINASHSLRPSPEHISCMVDLLGRSGRLKEAQELLKEIPEPSASVFASLLCACRCYSDPNMGEEMAKRLSELEPESAIPFVVLSNIYADQGRWEDVERVRNIINKRGVKKIPAFSSIGLT